MLIHEIEEKPQDALAIMERLVNDGPPAKTKYINNAELESNPWLTGEIQVYVCQWEQLEQTIVGQEPSTVKELLNPNQMFVHPDIMKRVRGVPVKTIAGIPTSSARTIYIPQNNFYIKLHYPTIMGRVDKSLTSEDVNAGVEITQLLKNAIVRGKVSEYLGFLPEVTGCIGRSGEEYSSFIIRDGNIIKNNQKEISYVCPGFSLTGRDWKRKKEKRILEQLIYEEKGIGKDPVEKLLFPIIDVYLSLLAYEGLQPELHSQNFLLAFDRNWELTTVVLRDLDSVQKNMSIREKLGIAGEVQMDYRCLWETQVNYREKNSFMYDFKVYEFTIRPIVDIIKSMCYTEDIIYKKIQEYVHSKFGETIADIFPKNGIWYKFEDVIICTDVKRRIFLRCENAKIR